jgi:hypothetical protein
VFEDKVGKFIDEIIEMLKPLNDYEVRRVFQLLDHDASFRCYFQLPIVISISYYKVLKRLFTLGFEAQLVWKYHAKRELTSEDRKELIEIFCKVFSPDEYDQTFEQIKQDIIETINIVKGVK